MIKKRIFAASEGNKRRMERAQWRSSFRYHGVSCFTGDRLTETSRRQTFTVSCSSCLIFAGLFHLLPRSHPQSRSQIVVALEKIHVKQRVDRDRRQLVPCSFHSFCLFSVPFTAHCTVFRIVDSQSCRFQFLSGFRLHDQPSVPTIPFDVFLILSTIIFTQCCALFFILEFFIYIRRFY